jgi:hypothetical protein
VVAVPRGFLGTRADFVMDVVLIVIVLNPLLMFFSFRKVRQLKYHTHQIILIFHILVAVLTYCFWIRLMISSVKNYKQSLPGVFSKKHIQLGKLIFKGMVITALTGTTLYILAFVL